MDAPAQDGSAEALRARLDELRGLGNVYAASGERPPPELAAEYQRIVEALARLSSSR